MYDFVQVPEGPFLMGSTVGDECGNDSPVHVWQFWMARYLVTKEEYAVFARKAGWSGQESPVWRGGHPVTHVSWHDAMAYCEWLTTGIQTTLLGEGMELEIFEKIYSGAFVVRLPTEAEWEKAARGGLERGQDGGRRRWPWGDQWEGDRANTREGNLGRTTPVGMYPRGASPYGILDMAGNVWEWTHSLYKNYPYGADDGREDPSGEGNRVLRGGSWYLTAGYARAAYRHVATPDYWYDRIGFRVVVARALKF